MAKKIKALRTINGSYGHLIEGAETIVADKLADELHAAGLVDIVSDQEAEPEVKAHKEVSVTVNGTKPKQGKK